MSAPVVDAVQRFELSGVVALWDLDLSVIVAGLPVLHFTATTGEGHALERGGVTYFPVAMEDSGFARGGAGAPPQPELRVGDPFRVLSGWVWALQDVVGAEVTRWLVLRDHLDDGADPDGAEYLLKDVYRIEQKLEQTPSSIAWRLVARWDQTAKQLPGRLILRDGCSHRYRVWDGSAWDYSQATCPYTGSSMFTVQDEATSTETEDRCSKLLSGCRRRFAAPAALPTTAFPGVGRRE